MFNIILQTIDIILWIFIAGSVCYILFYSLVYLLSREKKDKKSKSYYDSYHTEDKERYNTFLILFPAYQEDNVIINSVSSFLKQDYPQDLYHISVISDHMTATTNDTLAKMPITLHQPVFDNSSKAKAMQYAIAHTPTTYDYVVILDADNTTDVNFLSTLNKICNKYKGSAIQCHRCAKNSDTDIAILDGLSEEINNTIFRKSHNLIGLSSALIGSGMCFSYHWFYNNVNYLSTSGEDKELEERLLSQKIYIRYADMINVYDEKVGTEDVFRRQRLRWMTAQIQCLHLMLPHLFKAISDGNINYIDKTIQQALIPRSLLIVITFAIAVIITVISPINSIKWWILYIMTSLALLFAIPARLRKTVILCKSIKIPLLAWQMIKNLHKVDKNNKDFIHTNHNK